MTQSVKLTTQDGSHRIMDASSIFLLNLPHCFGPFEGGQYDLWRAKLDAYYSYPSFKGVRPVTRLLLQVVTNDSMPPTFHFPFKPKTVSHVTKYTFKLRLGYGNYR